MTYEKSLANFRNDVNRKFFPEMDEYSRTQSSINETSIKGYRGNNNGKSGKGSNTRKRSDGSSALYKYGVKRDVHPSYNFSSDVWRTTRQEERYRFT